MCDDDEGAFGCLLIVLAGMIFLVLCIYFDNRISYKKYVEPKNTVSEASMETPPPSMSEVFPAQEIRYSTVCMGNPPLSMGKTFPLQEIQYLYYPDNPVNWDKVPGGAPEGAISQISLTIYVRLSENGVLEVEQLGQQDHRLKAK